MAIITARAGTQFDPSVVEALPRALARHEWHVVERPEALLLTAGVGMDHDEPEMSDLFADQPDLRSAGPRGPAPAPRPSAPRRRTTRPWVG